MSVQAISWALKQKAGCPGSKLVLLCLANYADEDGYCWPSQATIAEETEQGERTVRRHIEALEARNLLKTEKRRVANGIFASDRCFLNINQRTIWPAANLADGQKQQSPAANLAGNPSEEEPPIQTHTARAPVPCPQDFEPTEQTRQYLGMAGIKAIDPLIVREFASHYFGTSVVLTLDGWQGRFRRWVIRDARIDAPTRRAIRSSKTSSHSDLDKRNFSTDKGTHGRL